MLGDLSIKKKLKERKRMNLAEMLPCEQMKGLALILESIQGQGLLKKELDKERLAGKEGGVTRLALLHPLLPLAVLPALALHTLLVLHLPPHLLAPDLIQERRKDEGEGEAYLILNLQLLLKRNEMLLVFLNRLS